MSDINTVLLDRDGTLITEEHYLRDPAKVSLIAGAGPLMRRLLELDVRFFLVTNQSGIGRGLLTTDAYHRVQDRLQTLLAAEGVHLHGTAFCPHAPDRQCPCRKPGTGLWGALDREHGLNPATTAMVGDKISDLRFGQAAGCRETVLVLTGHGHQAAAQLGLTVPDTPLLACPGGPDRPTWLAHSLAAYLEHLVQKKEHVHARRI